MATSAIRDFGARTELLRADELFFQYDSGHVALAGVSFDVCAGEFVSIVGPSGCGKTTLLKCIAGLMRATGGDLYLHNEPISSARNDLALVFQDYSQSLFPWLTVRKNVMFPLPRRAIDRRERNERAEEALAAVGLLNFGDSYPWQLSGGMQQRVAIARAIAYRPRVLLMDEPFASVDAQTRSDLEDVVLDVHSRFDMTTVFVTHDIDESVYLADRVLVLTKSPTRVTAEIDVSLPRPRDQIATKELDEFVRLRGEVARLIRAAATTSDRPNHID